MRELVSSLTPVPKSLTIGLLPPHSFLALKSSDSVEDVVAVSSECLTVWASSLNDQYNGPKWPEKTSLAEQVPMALLDSKEGCHLLDSFSPVL